MALVRKRRRRPRITEDYLYARPRTRKNPTGADAPHYAGRPHDPTMFMGDIAKQRKQRKRPPAGSRHDRSAERRHFGAGTTPAPPPKGRAYRKAKKIALAKSMASPEYRRKRRASKRAYSPSNPAYPSVAAKREAMRKAGKFRPGAKRVALGRRKRKAAIYGQLGGAKRR